MKQIFNMRGSVRLEMDEDSTDLRDNLFDFKDKDEEFYKKLNDITCKIMKVQLFESLKKGGSSNVSTSKAILLSMQKGEIGMQDIFLLACMMFIKSSNDLAKTLLKDFEDLEKRVDNLKLE